MYTHHYTVLDPTADLKVTEIASDIQAIIRETGIRIVGPSGNSDELPVFTGTVIAFNGCESESGEAFTYPPDFDWNRNNGLKEGHDWCKTYRRNYDPVVCAAVIALKHHLGDNVHITSDGHFVDEGWPEGYRLYREATGRELPDFFQTFGIMEDHGEGTYSMKLGFDDGYDRTIYVNACNLSHAIGVFKDWAERKGYEDGYVNTTFFRHGIEFVGEPGEVFGI